MNPVPKLSLTNENHLREWRKEGRGQKTKVLLIILAALAMVWVAIKIASSAPLPQMADGERRGAMRHGPEQQLDWLSERLKLTGDQKSRIKPILENEHKQLAAVREDSSLSRQEKRSKFRQIRSNALDAMRPLLTEEQRARLDEIQKEREEAMRARREKTHESAPEN
jgi:Spy/CpxP family protein refolding chaperone